MLGWGEDSASNRVKPVAGSCPCFLHIAPLSLSNAFFLPARLGARCGRAVGAGTYIDGSSKRSGLVRVSGVWGQDSVGRKRSVAEPPLSCLDCSLISF